MNYYRSQVAQMRGAHERSLERHPDGDQFFRLKITGNGSAATHHMNVNSDQLSRITEILAEGDSE